MVSSSAGRIIASNSQRVSRTGVREPGSATGIDRLGVEGERLLGLDAVPPQPGERRPSTLGIVGRGDGFDGLGRQLVEDVAEDRLVEVDPAELLDALRAAEQLEPGRRSRAARTTSKVPPPRS